ncbi:MAG: 50S ribosomal protein L25/general stress protein Ctc [Gemmatimonadetes bacterium]|nr:50S ribosomal protein L25/general stress protein Ctc [Gemmatimonadota bacterium]
MANEQPILTARPRSVSGKGSARQLRRSGQLPAVVYGRGDETQSLTLDTHELTRLLSRIRAATTVIDLQVEGDDPRQVLIREIQRHPYRSDLLHVDFFHIRADEKIKVQIPVHLEGDSKGVDLGGILQQIRYELEVECLPTEIPGAFKVDVTELDIGDSIHIGEIDAGDVVIMDDAELTICTVVPPSVEEEPEVDEELEEGEEGVEAAADEAAADGETESDAADEGGE